MKVIFINRFFHPDLSATSQMLSDQAFALARNGHQIVVITSRQDYSDNSKRYPAKEEIDGVTVRRVWTSRFGRFTLMGRALDYFSFFVTSAWRLAVLVRPGDVIVAKTDPPMLSLLAYPICTMRGAKLVNWLQDLFPEVATALDMGRGRVSKTLFSVLRRWRDKTLRKAHTNVVIGTHMAEHVKALSVEPNRIVTIPNWADGALLKPTPHNLNSLRREWGLDNHFVVAHSGNLGRAHDHLAFLQAIASLERQPSTTNLPAQLHQSIGGTALASDPTPPSLTIRWLFIGGGANYSKLQEEVRKQGLKSVEFRPYQPRERLAESLSCADVHLVTLRPEMEGLIVPSKIYGTLAVGRPIAFVGARDGEIAQLIRQHDCGIAIDENDGEGLAQAIRKMAGDPELTAKMSANSRRALDNEFELRHATNRWQELIDGVSTRA